MHFWSAILVLAELFSSIPPHLPPPPHPQKNKTKTKTHKEESYDWARAGSVSCGTSAQVMGFVGGIPTVMCSLWIGFWKTPTIMCSLWIGFWKTPTIMCSLWVGFWKTPTIMCSLWIGFWKTPTIMCSLWIGFWKTPTIMCSLWIGFWKFLPTNVGLDVTNHLLSYLQLSLSLTRSSPHTVSILTAQHRHSLVCSSLPSLVVVFTLTLSLSCMTSM